MGTSYPFFTDLLCAPPTTARMRSGKHTPVIIESHSPRLFIREFFFGGGGGVYSLRSRRSRVPEAWVSI